MPPIRFGAGGRFELQPAECRVLVDGQPTALGGRALDLLIALAARPSQLLTKNQLLDLVWPGVVVEEGNLRVQINSLRRLFGDDVVATVPGRGYRFSAPLWAEPGADVQPPTQAGKAATGVQPALPAQRLFGRADDLARLEGLLQPGSGTGCVTLVGSAGVGKSSLARAAMARWRGRTLWVDLAALTALPGSAGQSTQETPGAAHTPVAAALGRALGVQWTEETLAPQLQRALAAAQADADAMPQLVVLDNAEHVIEAAAELAASWHTLTPVQLLVTSQLPLAVNGERVLRLEPLHVGAAGLDDLGDGALALLVERIVAADHRFRLDPGALPQLTSLCEQLDGLPLALEMAAVRVPLMGLQAVHDALAQRFALLTRGRRDAPTRHRSLNDALAWSYRLLGPPEQALFRAFGVFTGGFTLELAVALAGGAADKPLQRWDIVDGLATLVERSLVCVSAEDPPRYRMLETMRAFALQQLASPPKGLHEPAAAEDSAVRRRHAAAMLALFERADADALCLAEMENARDAFAWARENDFETAVRLGSRMARISAFSVWRQQATDWMLSLRPAMDEPALAQALPPQVQAEWWAALAYGLNMRRCSAAREAARRSVELWRPLQRPQELLLATVQWVRSFEEPDPELDQACADMQAQAAAIELLPRERLRVHGAQARAARVRGDSEALLAHHRAEVTLARQIGWLEMMQAAESNVCHVLNEQGRHEEAAEQGLALLAGIDAVDGDQNANLPWVFNSLIEALTALGRLDEAQALVPRATVAGRRADLPSLWVGLAALAVAQRRWRVAAGLIGHVRQHSAAVLYDEDTSRLEALEAMVVVALGQGPAQALVMRGRMLNQEGAASLACAS